MKKSMVATCDNNQSDLAEMLDLLVKKFGGEKKPYMNGGNVNSNSILRFCNDKGVHVEFNSPEGQVVVHYTEEVDEAFAESNKVKKEDLDSDLPFSI